MQLSRAEGHACWLIAVTTASSNSHSSRSKQGLASTAIWMRPGTKVFWGEPLMKGTPSSTQAAPNRLLGDTSGSSLSMAAMKFSAVSFRPSSTCSMHLPVRAACCKLNMVMCVCAHAFQHTGCPKQAAGRDLRIVPVDGCHEVLGSVVQAAQHLPTACHSNSARHLWCASRSGNIMAALQAVTVPAPASSDFTLSDKAAVTGLHRSAPLLILQAGAHASFVRLHMHFASPAALPALAVLTSL